MSATAQQLAMLNSVNDGVNAIPYDAVPKAGQDPNEWINAPDGGEFECRDYAVAKAKLLQERGWPVADMSIVECWIEPEPLPGAPDGSAPVRQWHAVLAARAGGDILILDNRVPGRVYDWRYPPYPYIWGREQIVGSTQFRDASGGLV